MYKIQVVFLALLLSMNVIGSNLPKVFITTSMGEIVVEVDTVNAPVSAVNFLNHVEAGTYTNAAFYRVVRLDNQPNNSVKIEVIQGGVYSEKRMEGIEAIRHETTKETGLNHKNGTISMARAAVGTASTEFFICINDQPELDFGGKRNPDGQGFAAFGQVVKGMDIVWKIQKQKDEGQMLVEKVVIKKMEILD